MNIELTDDGVGMKNKESAGSGLVTIEQKIEGELNGKLILLSTPHWNEYKDYDSNKLKEMTLYRVLIVEDHQCSSQGLIETLHEADDYYVQM